MHLVLAYDPNSELLERMAGVIRHSLSEDWIVTIENSDEVKHSARNCALAIYLIDGMPILDKSDHLWPYTRIGNLGWWMQDFYPTNLKLFLCFLFTPNPSSEEQAIQEAVRTIGENLSTGQVHGYAIPANNEIIQHQIRSAEALLLHP